MKNIWSEFMFPLGSNQLNWVAVASSIFICVLLLILVLFYVKTHLLHKSWHLRLLMLVYKSILNLIFGHHWRLSSSQRQTSDFHFVYWITESFSIESKCWNNSCLMWNATFDWIIDPNILIISVFLHFLWDSFCFSFLLLSSLCTWLLVGLTWTNQMLEDTMYVIQVQGYWCNLCVCAFTCEDLPYVGMLVNIYYQFDTIWE